MFVLWAIAGIASKRTIRVESDNASRVVVLIIAFSWFLLFTRGFRRGPLAWRIVPDAPLVVNIGVVLTVVGLALAVWARLYIGRNWDAFVALKDDHEFIRTGPYAIVRHPIYAGFMCAALGTALVGGTLHAFIAVTLIVLAWGYKARLEEHFMKKQFGAQYEQYCRDVKGLLPFVW
ncbi:MAG TPA: isoprenylcysteine carboxylmethyltransferase family protein [Vicinamibacterales bacterium]